jgi:acetyltransferase-like isoleucine patch superfamily enzyme
MTTNPVLVLGSVRGNILERVETARLLGLDPVCVLFDESPSHFSVQTRTFDELPNRLRNAPCILGTPRAYPDLANERRDKRWLVSNSRFVKELEELGFNNWLTLIHPSASVSESAVLGKGCFIGPLVSISSETKLGSFVSIGRGSSIGHDVLVGDFCSFGPGSVVPGKVEFGSFTLVGPAATFLNGLRISEGSLIGAGSVVTKHVRNGHQVMGNPARRLRRPLAMLKRMLRQTTIRLLRKSGNYERVKALYRRLRG